MRTRYYIFLYILTILCLSGCLNKKKLLGKNQYLLYNQTIKGANKVSEDDLEAFYRQKANQRLFGTGIMPYLWFYSIGLKFYNRDKIKIKMEEVLEKYNQKIATAKNPARVKRLKKLKDNKLDKLQTKLEDGNFLMRKLGEPPVIFDTTLARQTTEQMRNYLVSKGFYNGTTRYTFKLDTSSRTAKVTYFITENNPYLIHDVEYVTDNPTIDSLITTKLTKEALQPGTVYEKEDVETERERIDKILKNNGYFNFSKQYITYQLDSTVIDTSLGTHLVDVRTVINKPAGQDKHKQYRISEIFFTTDANTSGKSTRDTVTYNNVVYLSYEPHRFSKKILDNKLMIHPGQLYSLQSTLETQRLLSSLDIFKFANVFYDTTGSKFIARINTSPIEKYTISDEIGVNVSQGYPGPFANVTFKARNIFGGLEIFELSAQGSIIGQSGITENTQLYSSQEVGVNASLIFPQIVFPTPFRHQFNRYSPRTRLLVGYNFTNRPEYSRYNIKGSMSYSFQKDLKHQFIITPVDLNLLNTLSLSQSFKDTLVSLEKRGSNLIKSFQTSFVSSISGSYTYNENLGTNTRPREAKYFRIFAETGGTFLNLINLVAPSVNTDSVQNIRLFKYFKINPEFRYYLPAGKNNTWAFRVNVGIANPYGQANKLLPYEKYFFAGGSNSIRAWPVRRLGPGADPDLLVKDGQPGEINYAENYRDEQPGDILIETSAEYRFDIISFLEGAVFVDAGNVWVLSSELNKPEAIFRFDRFYKQIAVGTGFGFRFDFSFLILRFDLGMKVYDPGKPKGREFLLKEIDLSQASWRAPLGIRQQFVLNVGIGYPF